LKLSILFHFALGGCCLSLFAIKSALFELFNYTRVRRMTIDVDHPWSARASLQNRKLEESFGRRQISFR
jgi:hypothetical protein